MSENTPHPNAQYAILAVSHDEAYINYKKHKICPAIREQYPDNPVEDVLDGTISCDEDCNVCAGKGLYFIGEEEPPELKRARGKPKKRKDYKMSQHGKRERSTRMKTLRLKRSRESYEGITFEAYDAWRCECWLIHNIPEQIAERWHNPMRHTCKCGRTKIFHNGIAKVERDVI